ncbi:hypothetical protein Csa_023989, partial [Cucumis sativus]
KWEDMAMESPEKEVPGKVEEGRKWWGIEICWWFR